MFIQTSQFKTEDASWKNSGHLGPTVPVSISDITVNELTSEGEVPAGSKRDFLYFIFLQTINKYTHSRPIKIIISAVNSTCGYGTSPLSFWPRHFNC